MAEKDLKPGIFATAIEKVCDYNERSCECFGEGECCFIYIIYFLQLGKENSVCEIISQTIRILYYVESSKKFINPSNEVLNEGCHEESSWA